MNDQATIEIESKKTDRAALADLLHLAGATGTHRRYFLCPFHSDRHPSAELRQAQGTGVWYFYCFTCRIADDYWDLKARIEGRDVADILREIRLQNVNAGPRSVSGVLTHAPTPPEQREAAKLANPDGFKAGPQWENSGFATIEDLIAFYRRKNPQIVIEERNEYANPETRAIELVTIRYRRQPGAKKEFLQATPCPFGWLNKGISGDVLPIFNRSRVKMMPRILVVEGEKCVRAVTELGFNDLAATTSPGGSKNARRADWSLLAGKTVYLWADNDDPGAEYISGVIEKLKELSPPCQLYRVDIAELEMAQGGDIYDYIQENEGGVSARDAIELVLMDAESLNPAGHLEQRIEDMIEGRYRAVPFLSRPILSGSTKAVLPGAVTTLCGEEGRGKSFLVLEDLWRWTEAGESVDLLMMEEDEAFHLNRAFAQMAGEPDVLDDEFIRDNPDWIRDLYSKYKSRLETIALHLTCAEQELTLDQVADWIESRNSRIRIVDPITAAMNEGRESWKKDQEFMLRTKRKAKEDGYSVILTSHPKGGKNGVPSLSGVAGGKAYTRFASSVLWLRHYEKLKPCYVMADGRRETREIALALEVRKARNKGGNGVNIAMFLNQHNLCLEEIGIITGDVKG